MVVWVWGSGTTRPQIRSGSSNGFSMINGPISNVTVMGLRITPRTYLTNGQDGDAGGVRIILNGGGNFLFMDGSTRWVSNAVDLNVMRALCTRNGGEPVSASDF